MERRSVSELKEHFQRILRDAEMDPEFVVTDAEETEGSQVGDNYMSVVLKSTIKGRRGNGVVFTGSFMTKYYPRHRAIAERMNTVDLFINEASMYNYMLPQLGEIAPRCIVANQDEIVMVDLKSEGYMTMPRLELLDLEHCTAVVQALAKLHARSFALKHHEPERFREIMSLTKEGIFPQDNAPGITDYLNMSIAGAVDQLKSLEDSEELQSAILFMESLPGQAVDIMKKLVVPDQGKYDVLSHGDAWNNNILFKHDEHNNVIDVKLIDFQIPRHASAAIDFHYFMYSSAKSIVIEQNYEHLIESYHSALTEHLKEAKVPDEHIRGMSLTWFNEELQKLHMYGLLTSIWLVNAVLAEENETVNMDDLGENFMEDMNKFMPIVSRRKAERIRCCVCHCMRRYRTRPTRV